LRADPVGHAEAQPGGELLALHAGRAFSAG
jgi:hypothetical protein